MGLAAKRGHLRTRAGPKDPTMRKARVCFGHLAGEMGVRLFDSLIQQNVLEATNVGGIQVMAAGAEYISGFRVGPFASDERETACLSLMPRLERPAYPPGRWAARGIARPFL